MGLNPYFLGSLSICVLDMKPVTSCLSKSLFSWKPIYHEVVKGEYVRVLSKSLFSWKPIYLIYFQCIIVFSKSSNLQCLYTQHCSKLTNFSQIYGFIGHFPSVLIEKKYSSY